MSTSRKSEVGEVLASFGRNLVAGWLAEFLYLRRTLEQLFLMPLYIHQKTQLCALAAWFECWVF